MRNRSLLILVALTVLLVSMVSSSTSYLYIVLSNPGNNSWSNSRDVVFYHIPYSNESIANCSLVLNGGINQTDNNISQGIENSFSSNLSEGCYLWSIECYTNSTNATNSSYNSSKQRVLYVDKTSPSILAVSPVDSFNTTNRNISFVFNVTDNLDNSPFCRILIDDVEYEMNTSLGINTKNVSEIYYGNHTWSAECWDSAQNRGFGENRSLTITPQNVSFSITTDKQQYGLNEQVDMIINAPVNTNLEIEIFKQGELGLYDVFTTVITNPQTTFFRSFNENGTYVVNASFDYYGYSQLNTISFSVIGSRLTASIDVDDDFVKVGQSINFEAVVSNNIGSVSYKWDFDNDGDVDSTKKEVDHSYDDDGTKTVNLTVEDELKRVSVTKSINVREEFKLHFKVLENVTDKVIKNATIELDNKENYTNDNGELDLYVLDDEYALAVRKSGYYTYYDDLDVDDNKSLTIRLNKKSKDIKPPQISLMSPENNKVMKTDSVNLKFKAIDESSFNCTVFYSEYANWYKPLKINKRMENNTETVVGLAELVEGKNYWKVECVDVFGNKGVSDRFVINVELPKAEESTEQEYEEEDDLGIFSNNIIEDIDSTLNSMGGWTPDQKDVAEALDLRKHLDESKNELQKVRRDIHNLQFLDLTPTEEANERKQLREVVEDIESSTIKSITVTNKAEYTRYPLDEDVAELSVEFLDTKNLSLGKRQQAEFIEKNKDAQSLITVSVKAWNAELEYISGDRETITLVEKSVHKGGDYNGYSIVEFIPKSVVDNLKKIEFLTLYSTIKSDPIVKIDLNKDNKSIYYIKGGISLADIDKTNTLLVYDGVESYKTKPGVTGFAVFENIGGLSNVVFIVLLFVVLISGYVVYKQQLLDVDVSGIANLRERMKSRKDIRRIRELVDLAHIRLRNNQLRDAHFTYGEINLIYRELPEGCRRAVYGDVMGLGKQMDIHYLHSLMDDVQNSLRYNQVERAFEVYNKIKGVYKNFDKHQKRVVYSKMVRLLEEIKRKCKKGLK